MATWLLSIRAFLCRRDLCLNFPIYWRQKRYKIVAFIFLRTSFKLIINQTFLVHNTTRKNRVCVCYHHIVVWSTKCFPRPSGNDFINTQPAFYGVHYRHVKLCFLRSVASPLYFIEPFTTVNENRFQSYKTILCRGAMFFADMAVLCSKAVLYLTI